MNSLSSIQFPVCSDKNNPSAIIDKLIADYTELQIKETTEEIESESNGEENSEKCISYLEAMHLIKRFKEFSSVREPSILANIMRNGQKFSEILMCEANAK